MRRLIEYVAVVTFMFVCNPVMAQYFDWVERYTGSEATGNNQTNLIRQSVIDSEGNVYFVGRCATDAGFHGNRFLPITPYGPNCNTGCLVIGKLSYDGNLVWSKVIHGNNSANHGGGYIQMLGDTAVACMSHVHIPPSYPHSWPPRPMDYLFYLDTLMTFFEDDSIVHQGFCLYDYNRFFSMSNSATAYIVFDLDGNIMEQHWLTVSLLKGNGEPYNMSEEYENWPELSCIIQTHELRCNAFAVDNNGSVVLSRNLMESVRVYDSVTGLMGGKWHDIRGPEVGGLRFYVDGKRYFDMPLPENRPSTAYHNFQILKFSPHFEELLASQFLFEPTAEHMDTVCDNNITDLRCDNDNNVYLLVNSDYNVSRTGEENCLRIGGSEDLELRFRSYDGGKGFLVKYDTALNPVYLRQYERDSSVTLVGTNGLGSAMWKSQFDDEGNMVIMGGASSMDSTITSCFFDTTELELRRVFIWVNPETGAVVSQGPGVTAEVFSPGGGYTSALDFVASGNRLIWHVKYRWYLDFADSLYEMPLQSQWGMGFAVWDYDGNELYFVDYGVNGSSNNATSSVCLRDSVLYLTGMLASGGAQFGDITVPNSGSSQSFIARYVDTAFMHPYVRPGSQQDIQLVVQDGEPVVTVYPNPCAQRVKVHYEGSEPLKSAFVTDITGRQHQVFLSAQGDGQYSVDFSSMPPANYLLTLITSSGKLITSRLLKR